MKNYITYFFIKKHNYGGIYSFFVIILMKGGFSETVEPVHKLEKKSYNILMKQ